jgi:DNA-binding LytR/AlgR family response regulator
VQQVAQLVRGFRAAEQAYAPFVFYAGFCASPPGAAASAIWGRFLDVHIPELTGLELLRSLPRPPLVVFTTAHPEYALPSYELDAVDYLLKPIPLRWSAFCEPRTRRMRGDPAASPPRHQWPGRHFRS